MSNPVLSASFNTTCDEPLTIPAGLPFKFAQVAAAVDALIAVATEPLYASYPFIPVKSICAEAVTTLSPPALNNLLSAPNAPAFQ